jgi:hypothetical protein
MFIDCLGREPTADELKDIRLNVWMLERAGFAVEDPSNAPHIAPWAWIWARVPRHEDAHAALAAAGREIAEHNQINAEALEALALEWLSKIDTEGVGAAIAKAMPALIVQNRLDASVFKAALRESLSLIWVWVSAACVALTGFVGWHFGALHQRAIFAPRMEQQAAELARQQHVIDQLTSSQPKR